MPSTTLRPPGVPVVVVVHDLRHELRPEQFGWSRKLMRRISYARAYALADVLIAVSQRTLDDLYRLHPRTAGTSAAVVHHGADHVASWANHAPDAGYAIAQGQHTNKNVALVVGAWRSLTDRGAELPLLILGLSEKDRRRTAGAVHAAGLDDRIRLSEYLPQPEFEATMAAARMLVFPSDFEGFGLPVLEAMRLGLPVVVGPDPAVLEVAGGHATVMDEWTAPALAAAVSRALSEGPADRDAARRHAEAFTWTETVRRTRGLIRTVTGP
jgi:glycosyltransferase involved in cell wall biosynthesis